MTRVSKVLTASQVHAFKQAFDGHVENDNTLSRTEFAEALKMVGIIPTADELQAMLDDIATERITLLDFISVIYHFLRECDTQDELIRAISVFDRDGDGKIDVDTAISVLTNLRHPIQNRKIDDVIARIREDDLIDCVKLVRELKPE